MDLSESFRVLRRHRILTFAMLLLTLLCAVGAAIKLPWQYKASATVTLLNSTASSKTTSGGNPYLAFNSSLVQTANVISIELGNPQTEQLLESGNYTSSYQAQVLSENPENEEPFILVSVNGSQAYAVEQTLHGVTAELKSLLATLQARVSPKDRADIQVISEDSQPARSSSAKIKPLVGLLAVGLALTYLIPQAADGRRRRRARNGRDAANDIKSPPRGMRPSADLEGYGQVPVTDPDRYRQVPGGRHENNQPWMTDQAGDGASTRHAPPGPHLGHGQNHPDLRDARYPYCCPVLQKRATVTPSEQDKPRAVLVVYSADALSTGSVTRIGYRVSKGIDTLADATLIFHARHRKDVASWFPEDRIIYAGSQRLAKGLRRIAHHLFPDRWGPITIIELLDYFVFDIDSYLKARRLVKTQRVDFLLRATPVSPRIASVLAYLPIPVFTGPHNGGMTWPPGFNYLDKKEKTAEGARFLGDIMHKIYRDTGRYAGIFAANEPTARTLGEAHRDKVVVIAENAVDKLGKPSPWSGDANRLLYVGRMVPFKSVDIILKAMAKIPASVHLTLVGAGPDRQELEKLAIDLGIRDRCEFVGHKPHEELEKYYSSAGVFVFPSVRESGGMVVLEAMAHALPCLVANWGGPPIYTRSAGIQLSVDSPRALEEDLVRALTRMLADPDEGRRVGLASREAIRDEYIWSRKAELLLGAICERIGITKQRARS